MAAVTIANLTSGFSNTDATSYNTASVTATAGRMLLVAVVNEKVATVTQPTLSSVLGGSVAVTVSVPFDTVASSTTRSTLFIVTGASGTGAITIDFGGVTQRACIWSVEEATNADTTTPRVSTNDQTETDDSADTTLIESMTFNAFGHTDNRPYVVIGSSIDAAVASGWTELSDVGSGATEAHLATMWGDGSDTTPTATSAVGHRVGIIGVEIKAAAVGGITEADLTVTAAATPSMTAAAIATGAASMAGVGTMSENSGATKGVLLNSDGLSTVALLSQAVAAAVLSSVGLSTVSFTAPAPEGDFTSVGAATVSLAGGTLKAASFTIDGTATVSLVSAAVAAGSIDSPGVAIVSLDGMSKRVIADLLAAGFAVVAFQGESVAGISNALQTFCASGASISFVTVSDVGEPWSPNCEVVLLIETEQELLLAGV